MSEAWKEAKNVVRVLKIELENYPNSLLNEELKKRELKQGDFKIDTYSESNSFFSEQIGMYIPFDTKIDKRQLYEKSVIFAKNNGLRLNKSFPALFLSLEGPDKKNVATIDDWMFSASTPELFQAIGEDIYGLSVDEKKNHSEKKYAVSPRIIRFWL